MKEKQFVNKKNDIIQSIHEFISVIDDQQRERFLFALENHLRRTTNTILVDIDEYNPALKNVKFNNYREEMIFKSFIHILEMTQNGKLKYEQLETYLNKFINENNS